MGLNWLRVDDYEAMSREGASRIAATLQRRIAEGRPMLLGLATGNTMIRLYERLAETINQQRLDRRAETFLTGHGRHDLPRGIQRVDGVEVDGGDRRPILDADLLHSCDVALGGRQGRGATRQRTAPPRAAA